MIAVGIAIGVVVGALGAGGGILTVPVLIYLLAQDPHTATSSSLVVVLISALFGLIHHARAGNVLWRDGAVFGALSVLGASVGSVLSPLIPPDVLLTAFALLLLAVAATMARKAWRTRRAERCPNDAQSHSADADQVGGTGRTTGGRSKRQRILLVGAMASATGILTGVFGVGGGFVVVPILVTVLAVGIRQAAATSLWVIVIASLASIATRTVDGNFDIDWTVTVLFALASGLGAVIGGPLSARARASTLTGAFAVLLLFVGV